MQSLPSCTFMQSAASKRLKLSKVVHQVAVLVLGLRGHVVQLPDVSLPDAQSEDLNASLSESSRHRSRVAPVRVAVSDEEDCLGSVPAGVTENLLLEKKIFTVIMHPTF